VAMLGNAPADGVDPAQPSFGKSRWTQTVTRYACELLRGTGLIGGRFGTSLVSMWCRRINVGNATTLTGLPAAVSGPMTEKSRRPVANAVATSDLSGPQSPRKASTRAVRLTVRALNALEIALLGPSRPGRHLLT